MTAKPMTQHVVMTAMRMTQRSCDDTGGDDLLRRMTLRDDRDADDTTRCDDNLRLMTAMRMTLRDYCLCESWLYLQGLKVLDFRGNWEYFI